MNGTVSKLLGRHTLKIGGDFRRVGLDNFAFGDASGFFNFDREWTQADPFRLSGTEGAGFASLVSIVFRSAGTAMAPGARRTTLAAVVRRS